MKFYSNFYASCTFDYVVYNNGKNASILVVPELVVLTMKIHISNFTYLKKIFLH